MSTTLIGYARCSLDTQDLTAQRQTLAGLGVAKDRIYLDHGLTGTNRARPGLDQALAAVRAGDTLVVPQTRPPRPLRATSATPSPPAASASPSAGRSTTPPTP